jgi:hypothetical protein
MQKFTFCSLLSTNFLRADTRFPPDDTATAFPPRAIPLDRAVCNQMSKNLPFSGANIDDSLIVSQRESVHLSPSHSLALGLVVASCERRLGLR